jgi:hypothetical protein
MPCGGKGFDFSGVWDVRSPTQIDQIATSVHRGPTSIRHLGLQNFDLERIVREQFQTFFLGNDQPLEFLFLFDDFFDVSFHGSVCMEEGKII